MAAGVSLIAYASFVNAETSTLRLAEEHKDTEAHIRNSGIRHVFLRIGAYTELYVGELGDLGPALDAGPSSAQIHARTRQVFPAA